MKQPSDYSMNVASDWASEYFHVEMHSDRVIQLALLIDGVRDAALEEAARLSDKLGAGTWATYDEDDRFATHIRALKAGAK